VGGAQKMIDLLGQELFIQLQSPLWQDRELAVSTILNKIGEYEQKESYQEVFN
jgi:hypothetical protein